MLRNWVMAGSVLLLFLSLAGCRKSMPDLKPPPTPEVLAMPPVDSRFNQNSYPKQAFADRESGLMKAGMQGRITPAMAGSGANMPGAGGVGGTAAPGLGGAGGTFR